MATIPFTFLLRRGTSAEWTQYDPVLGAGEPGVETDTGAFKFGTGTTPWSALPYSGRDVDQLLDTARAEAAADTTAALATVNGRIDTVTATLGGKADTGTLAALETTLRAEVAAARTAAEDRAAQLDAAQTTTLRGEIATAKAQATATAETRAGQLDATQATTLRGEIATARTGAVTDATAAAETRAGELDQVVLTTVRGEYSVGLRVPNIGIDTDGVPYYSEGQAGGQLLLDPEDGNPYFVITG